MKNRVDLWPN